MPRPKDDDSDAPLKRLGGGRWQARDERFTVEPQSGTWVVVDAEQTDDLGLPLVRGPFPSLTAAKEAIAAARTSGRAASPLADVLDRGRERKRAEPEPGRQAASGRSSRAAARETATDDEEPRRRRGRDGRAARKSKETEEAPREPAWLDDLEPDDRGRARRLIRRLEDEGVADAEGIVRRDLVGGVPALAAHAIEARLAELGTDASPADVVELLREGRDQGLGVRWRIVDGDGRPIVIEARQPRRAR